MQDCAILIGFNQSVMDIQRYSNVRCSQNGAFLAFQLLNPGSRYMSVPQQALSYSIQRQGQSCVVTWVSKSEIE